VNVLSRSVRFVLVSGVLIRILAGGPPLIPRDDHVQRLPVGSAFGGVAAAHLIAASGWRSVLGSMLGGVLL
jgi:hypothetical protein